MSKEQTGGVIVLFGGTGDLAESMIFPALHQLFKQEKFSDHFALVGVSRKDMSDQEYRDYAREAVVNENEEDEINEEFFKHLFYQSADNTELDDFEKLSETIQKAADEFDADSAITDDDFEPKNSAGIYDAPAQESYTFTPQPGINVPEYSFEPKTAKVKSEPAAPARNVGGANIYDMNKARPVNKFKLNSILLRDIYDAKNVATLMMEKDTFLY